MHCPGESVTLYVFAGAVCFMIGLYRAGRMISVGPCDGSKVFSQLYYYVNYFMFIILILLIYVTYIMCLLLCLSIYVIYIDEAGSGINLEPAFVTAALHERI